MGLDNLFEIFSIGIPVFLVISLIALTMVAFIAAVRFVIEFIHTFKNFKKHH